MAEQKIPIYDSGLNLMTVQSYLSVNDLLHAVLETHKRAVYVLKNHGGRICLEYSVFGGKSMSDIWTVKFSDRVDKNIIRKLIDIIEIKNESIREQNRRRVA